MFSHVRNSWRGSFSVHKISCFINAWSRILTTAVCVGFLFFFLDMGELSVSREGFTSYLGVPQDLKVRVGDDVVLKCSASSSEEPSYSWNKNVRERQECAHSGSVLIMLLETCHSLSHSLPRSGFSVTSLFFFSPVFFQSLLGLLFSLSFAQAFS